MRATAAVPVSCFLPPRPLRTCFPRLAPPLDMRLCLAGCSGEDCQLSRPFPCSQTLCTACASWALSTRPPPPSLAHSHSVRHHQRACPELKPLPSCSTPSQDFLPPRKTTMFTWTMSRCGLLFPPMPPLPYRPSAHSTPLSYCLWVAGSCPNHPSVPHLVFLISRYPVVCTDRWMAVSTSVLPVAVS